MYSVEDLILEENDFTRMNLVTKMRQIIELHLQKNKNAEKPTDYNKTDKSLI